MRKADLSLSSVRLGSGVSFRGKLFPSQLPGVKQMKPGESGPLAAELRLSGVLLS